MGRALSDLHPLQLVRDPSRAPDLGGHVRSVSYGTVTSADLAGIDTLFMVSAAEAPDRRDQHARMIAAAAEAGVQHIVYTSFSGAAPDATFTLGRDHFDAEQRILESGMTYTFLRDNFYLDILPSFADETGAIRGPAGDGRVAAVARADVADVAATVLRDPSAHADAVYELTGPEALTFVDLAARITAAIGRDVRYEQETLDEAFASRRATYPDAQEFELEAWVSTYTAIADGSCERVTDDVERVTGHPARTLEDTLNPPPEM